MYETYNKDHLQSILTDRLRSTPQVVDDSALKLCALKVEVLHNCSASPPAQHHLFISTKCLCAQREKAA